MDRLDDCVGRSRKEAVDEVRAGDWLGLRAAVAFELGPYACKGGQGAFVGQREPTTSFFPVSGFGAGAYSAKLLSGTSRPRQCGDAVLRILVTGGPPVRGGGGISQRIMVSSRSSPAFRTTGAGSSGNCPMTFEPLVTSYRKTARAREYCLPRLFSGSRGMPPGSSSR
jgi:hypothetical protein